MGGRRSAAEIETARRADEVRHAIGRDVAAARRRRGWTQVQVARRISTSQSAISRLERGVAPIEVADLVGVAHALDLTPRIELGRDPLDGPADAGHLAIQELLVGLAHATSGAALVELPLGIGDRTRSLESASIAARRAS